MKEHRRGRGGIASSDPQLANRKLLMLTRESREILRDCFEEISWVNGKSRNIKERVGDSYDIQCFTKHPMKMSGDFLLLFAGQLKDVNIPYF